MLTELRCDTCHKISPVLFLHPHRAFKVPTIITIGARNKANVIDETPFEAGEWGSCYECGILLKLRDIEGMFQQGRWPAWFKPTLTNTYRTLIENITSWDTVAVDLKLMNERWPTR